ncbi:MAG: PfkB family carbohydrate kinase [Ferruginibacter sp.]
MMLLQSRLHILQDKGIETVILTLGSRVGMVLHQDKCLIIEAPKVVAIDTTAAGDVFNGALVVSLSEGNDVLTATSFACQAAAVSVTKMGAQASAPYKNEGACYGRKKSCIKNYSIQWLNE